MHPDVRYFGLIVTCLGFNTMISASAKNKPTDSTVAIEEIDIVADKYAKMLRFPYFVMGAIGFVLTSICLLNYLHLWIVYHLFLLGVQFISRPQATACSTVLKTWLKKS